MNTEADLDRILVCGGSAGGFCAIHQSLSHPLSVRAILLQYPLVVSSFPSKNSLIETYVGQLANRRLQNDQSYKRHASISFHHIRLTNLSCIPIHYKLHVPVNASLLSR